MRITDKEFCTALRQFTTFSDNGKKGEYEKTYKKDLLHWFQYETNNKQITLYRLNGKVKFRVTTHKIKPGQVFSTKQYEKF